MVEKNIVDAVVIPETPKVQEGAVEMVYVPVATNDTKGIASYDEEAFKVIDGKVYINSKYVDDKVKLVDDKLGEIQVCCMSGRYISSSSWFEIDKKWIDGVPEVGKYMSAVNAIALITKIEGDKVTVQPRNPLLIYLNGAPNSPGNYFYAPRSAGSSGQVLVSTGKAPEWKNIGDVVVNTGASKLTVTQDNTNYRYTFQLKDSNGVVLSDAMIDLPIETLVMDVSYLEQTNELKVTLKNGNEFIIPLDKVLSATPFFVGEDGYIYGKD